MNRTIILAPGAKKHELDKSLARNNVTSINRLVYSATELALEALAEYGASPVEKQIGAREEVEIVAGAIRNVGYFAASTYSDIKEIAGAIRRMRSLVTGNDEIGQVEDAMLSGIFEEKNAALVEVYKNYIHDLASEEKIDSVSLIRRAISVCDKMDAKFCTLKEFPVSPIERELIEVLSGGDHEEITLRDLYNVSAMKVKINSFRNCYGAPNEVETILADIFADKDPCDCTVAVTDADTYGQLFFDYALLYDIPVSINCGVPIINSNPAKLLKLYYTWMTSGFFSEGSLNAMLSSGAFNRRALNDAYPKEENEDFDRKVYRQVLGSIRLTNDAKINRSRIDNFAKAVKGDKQKEACIPYLEVIAKELALPAEDFICRYSYIRKGSDKRSGKLVMLLDQAADNAIYRMLGIIREMGIEQATEDMIAEVLNMSVACGCGEEGLLVTSIEGALCAVRKNLYIAGLCATKYPGSPKENYLLLDADLELFGNDAEYMMSAGRIKHKKDTLISLVELASALGSSINVSYAGLNVSDLKKDNASSLIYELFRMEHGQSATSNDLDKNIEKVGYFAPDVSATRKIGEAYNKGMNITLHPLDEPEDLDEKCDDIDKHYSPSALDDFQRCPRAFFLGRILGIPEPDDDDPFEVIAANESGTLAHQLMEKLANSNMSKDDFHKLSEEAFDRFMEENPPLVDGDAAVAKESFLEMMDMSYDMDPHIEVVMAEEDISCEHDSGIKLHGLPDRVEKLDDGTYRIVDYKTGRTVRHIEDNIETCLQVVIYAYLFEHANPGCKVSEAEYRYIRLGQKIRCRYDEAMKLKLNNMLTDFKEALEKTEFPITPLALDRPNDVDDPCEYCKYGTICGKGV